ncbi:hypothetical protein LOD99_7261 [Oopsacas minuta]|uniref:Uncharacterized protein n=1 Tax=Oopsacas minuta TaxID=111878 RepID=A0AAV7JTK1_9METZ|nr:hypothetical protein LOD99_7261 [Oopsacas minuta]
MSEVMDILNDTALLVEELGGDNPSRLESPLQIKTADAEIPEAKQADLILFSPASLCKLPSKLSIWHCQTCQSGSGPPGELSPRTCGTRVICPPDLWH